MCNPIKFVLKQIFLFQNNTKILFGKKYFGTKNSYWALCDSLTANRPSDF